MPEVRELRLWGDEIARGREWNLDRCQGLFLLIKYYLGEDVTPIAFGISGRVPTVWVKVEGFNKVFRIYEFLTCYSNGMRRVHYAATFNFSTYVDTRPDISRELFYMEI